MRTRAPENQEELMACLEVVHENGYEPGDRMIKDRYVKTAKSVIISDFRQTLDPDELHEPYIIWDAKGGPLLVCHDDELYRLTGLEALMVRAGITKVRVLDDRHHRQDYQG